MFVSPCRLLIIDSNTNYLLLKPERKLSVNQFYPISIQLTNLTFLPMDNVELLSTT